MEYRFVIESPEARKVARTAVEADVRSARLSLAYRCYYAVRRWLPFALRQKLQRVCAAEVSPNWFLPNQHYDRLAQGVQHDASNIPIIHPWPDGAECAFVLTHDIESPQGIKNIVPIADLEEELGFRSSWNMVAFGEPIDPGLVRDLRQRSFEVGIHGYNHDGRLFASRSTFDRRSTFINEAIIKWDVKGFRAPMVHRNLEWMQQLGIDYDCSCFDIDPFQPMPGGVGSIWPFIAGRFVEIPYTMPQDHSLFVLLNESSGAIWNQKAEWLRRRQGMMVMLTHPDYLDSERRLAIYRDFLVKTKEQGNFWHALPGAMATWWRNRDASTVETNDGEYRIQGPARDQGVLAQVVENEGIIHFPTLRGCDSLKVESAKTPACES